MRWKVLDTGKSSAAINMETDARLLENLSKLSAPLLHFYDWETTSATYGYFTKPEEHLHLANLQNHELTLARRPTGGGIIFHQYDLAFSALVPSDFVKFSMNTMENYAFINSRVILALSIFLQGKELPQLLPEEDKEIRPFCASFCMAKPTKYDVMLGGRKVGGGAQRRTKDGYLHQGSICLALPHEAFFKDILRESACVYDSMLKHSCVLIDSTHPKTVAEARDTLKDLLINAFQA